MMRLQAVADHFERYNEGGFDLAPAKRISEGFRRLVNLFWRSSQPVITHLHNNGLSEFLSPEYRGR
jgi:hypothetical protein